MPGARKLRKDIAHRTVMLRGTVTFLLEGGKIKIIVTCAKEVRSLTEKLITLAQEDNLHNQRMALSLTAKKDVICKLFSETAPKCTDRKGEYIRVIKIGLRHGNATKMAITELI